MDCTVIVLAGGQGLRMGGLGQLMAKTAMVAYDWPLLIRALHQMREHGFSRVVISTNTTFYPQLSALIASYVEGTTRHNPHYSADDIRVIENPAHEGGPLPALAEALKYADTRRVLLYLADEFQLANPFADFAAVLPDDADYLGCAIPAYPRELLRGGLVYAHEDGESYSIVEKPETNPGANGLRWTGVALFSRDLIDDLAQFFTQHPANLAVGEIFEFRRAMGKPVRAIVGPDFLNVNSPDHLLLAGLYVAMEKHAHQPELCASLAIAAAALREKM